MEYLDGFDGMTICDFGCGYGSDLLAIHEKFPHAEIAGIDQSSGMIDAAKAAVQSGTFIVGAIEAIPHDAMFDRILVRHVLHLVPNPEEAIETCIGHVSPNGKAIFVLHSNTSQPKFATWLRWAEEHLHVTYTSPSNAFTIESHVELFTKEVHATTTKLITQSIVLHDAEPYVQYMASQKRWSRPLEEEEQKRLFAHVRAEIEKEIAEKGFFEELSINGIVTVQKL